MPNAATLATATVALLGCRLLEQPPTTRALAATVFYRDVARGAIDLPPVYNISGGIQALEAANELIGSDRHSGNSQNSNQFSPREIAIVHGISLGRKFVRRLTLRRDSSNGVNLRQSADNPFSD